MKPHRILILAALALVASCGSKEDAERSAAESPTPEEILAATPETHGSMVSSVELTTPLNQDWVAKGKAIYEMKCLACHKTDGTKLVGPGWKGVTQRRKPEWIMNMILNVDTMLETDEEAQKLLEQCLVRMPNQNLSKQEAREVLEFMRSNDAEP
ncbi:MAG: cytochrome c [Verrucomicrobiae bacterium]|nr:cytochrome c [Verrucomicrobiae bacterium]